jgi:hypothetical protein
VFRVERGLVFGFFARFRDGFICLNSKVLEAASGRPSVAGPNKAVVNPDSASPGRPACFYVPSITRYAVDFERSGVILNREHAR